MCIYIICTFSCILKVHINKYSSKSYFSDFIKRNISHIPINSEHIYLSIPFPIFLLTSSQRFSSKVLSFKLLFCHYKRGWSFHVVNICISPSTQISTPASSNVRNEIPFGEFVFSALYVVWALFSIDVLCTVLVNTYLRLSQRKSFQVFNL